MNINVKLYPNSNKNEITGQGQEYTAYVKEKAEDNKANVALIKLISKKLDINYKKIKILTPTSRKKIIKIDI